MKIKKKTLFIIILLLLFAVDCVIGWAILTVVGWLLNLTINWVVVGTAGLFILILQLLVAAIMKNNRCYR